MIAHYGSDRAGAEAATADAKPGQVTLLQADLADMAAVDTFWEKAVTAANGRIDVLINNAGVMQQAGGIEDPIENWDEAWEQSMAVNVHAPARLLRHAVRNWLDAGFGWVGDRDRQLGDHARHIKSRCHCLCCFKSSDRGGDQDSRAKLR